MRGHATLKYGSPAALGASLLLLWPQALPGQAKAPPGFRAAATGLSDQSKVVMKSGPTGVTLAMVDLVARVDSLPASIVVVSAFVRDAKVQRTGRQELTVTRSGDARKPGFAAAAVINGVFAPRPGSAITLGQVPLSELVRPDQTLSANQFRPTDAYLPASHFLPAAAIRNPETFRGSAVRDWDASSISAATPRGMDWSRFDALYVAAVAPATTNVQPLVILVPRR